MHWRTKGEDGVLHNKSVLVMERDEALKLAGYLAAVLPDHRGPGFGDPVSLAAELLSALDSPATYQYDPATVGA